MKYCPICNSEYNDEFFFCEHDGNKLEDKQESKQGFTIGDKNIVTGDISVSQSNSNALDSEISSAKNLSIGDKNVISGDINVDHTTNIDTVVINKDDTNQVVKCSASGRSIRIVESFQCRKCNQIFHNDYLQESKGQCSFCENTDKNIQEERLKSMISERLSDMVIDEQELSELIGFANSVGYPKEKLDQLISDTKIELLEKVGQSLSQYEQELLKISRIYFDSFDMIKLKESIGQLYPKFKAKNEIRWYYFVSNAFVDSSEYKIIKESINYDEVELLKADYFISVHNSNFDKSSQTLSKINVSFSEHVFPKLMQFDLELHKFLVNPYEEDEFAKLQQVLPGFLKQQIKYESYPFEEGLQRFSQGLFVLLFKMPFKSLFDNNVLAGLKQTSEFGYNRFISSNFWKDSLKSQNEIYRILKVSGNNKQVLELCERPLLRALNEYKLGKLDSVVHSDDFKFNTLDPKVKNSFDLSFIESNRCLSFEKTIPFTDILIDNGGGISVPISLKYKVACKVTDLNPAAEALAGASKLGLEDVQRALGKVFMDKVLSDFGRIMNSIKVRIDELSSRTADFEKLFIELNEASFKKKYGVIIHEFNVIRLTPDKESKGYLRAISAGKPPAMISSNNMYHMNVNNVNYGPYSVQQLSGMVSTGQFTNETMVWCEGMAQWDYAQNVNELKQFF